MARHHLVISGTGRAGTTFLVELLTYLGFDTGFTPHKLAERKDDNARAGFDRDIRREQSPYVVKSPQFCDAAEDVLAGEEIIVDHVIIPIRDVYAAAQSRRHVQAQAQARESLLMRMAKTLRPRHDPGGLWQTTNGDEQEIILLQKLYKLMLALSGAAVPVTLLRFPRLVQDPSYLFHKLKPVLRNITLDEFIAEFERTVNPSLVHSFSAADR